LDSSILIIATSPILTANIGQSLTAHHFTDWQLEGSADRALYLANKLKPAYIIMDISTVDGDLGTHCFDLAKRSEGAIILIINSVTTLSISDAVEKAREKCPQIIAIYEFPVDVTMLVEELAWHRDKPQNKTAAHDSLQLINDAANDAASGVADWIKNHPDITSCIYISNEGQVKEKYGPMEQGQGEAAHYIMAVGRILGAELELTNLVEFRMHSAEKRFLAIETPEHIVAINAKPKVELRSLIEKLAP
jgi:chemotaxis response regulator CheB